MKQGGPKISAPPHPVLYGFCSLLLCPLLSIPHFAVRFPLTSLTAVFHIASGGGKCFPAVSADTFPLSAFRRLLPVEFRPAVRAAEQSIRPPGFKFFSTAFADQLERLTDSVFTGLDLLVAFTALNTMPVQGSLPFFFLRCQLRGGEVKPPDKLQINLDFLRPVAVYLFRGMDDDLFDELVYHGRGQFRKIRVLLRQGEEPFHIGGVLLEAVQRRFRLHDGLPERSLFLLIPGKQSIKAFLADAPNRIGFVQLLDDGVQFLTPPLVLVQLAFQFLCRLRLPDFGRRPYLLDKLGLVGNGVGTGVTDGLQNQCPQSLGGDVVITASTVVRLPGQRVGGAVEPVRRVGLGSVSSRPMVILSTPI